MIHMCETIEDGVRPCPVDLCEAEVLNAALEIACKDLSAYSGDATLFKEHFLKRARQALETA